MALKQPETSSITLIDINFETAQSELTFLWLVEASKILFSLTFFCCYLPCEMFERFYVHVYILPWKFAIKTGGREKKGN